MCVCLISHHVSVHVCVCVCVCVCVLKPPQVLAPFVGGACCYSDGVIATVDELVAPSVLSGGSVGRSVGWLQS